MKLCPRCGEAKPLTDYYQDSSRVSGYGCYCKKCHNSNMDQWRDRNSETDKANKKRYATSSRGREVNRRAVQAHKLRFPQKNRARHLLQQAVESGKISKPDLCSKCGDAPELRDLHGHHEDYAKPIEVVWLCRQCHNKLHETYRRAADTNGDGVYDYKLDDPPQLW